jgi:hypothetical protein
LRRRSSAAELTARRAEETAWELPEMNDLNKLAGALAIGLLSAAPQANANPAGLTPEQAEAFAPVATLFRGLSTKDASLIREVLIPEGSATIYRDGKFLRMSLADLADRLVQITAAPGHFEEKMDSSLVRVDHNIAVVWGSYTAFKDGVPHHCGSNLLSLVNENGQWRIASVTDTSRECAKADAPKASGG